MSLSGPLCAVNIFPRSSAVRFHASMTRFHPRAVMHATRVQFSAAVLKCTLLQHSGRESTSCKHAHFHSHFVSLF